MLSLYNIVKTYTTGDTTVTALDGVSVDFREHEFVSILGPSGCGKTTLLNVIGGLDRYDSGDLVIDGRSTKEYRDADWDAYRNHSVGFVFQSYNLIMHQTVLANVELALTLSGVSREERRARAIKALTDVGLGDQIDKKPTQMSGGQMQRVAIARALVNDPEIILADEPTGALDTATSVQIMNILKEISKDKLIVMVTHNPELAEEYSSRIIRMKDGRMTEDTNPYKAEEGAVKEPVLTVEEPAPAPKRKKENKRKKPAMSFFTALSLSFNNLLTKKTRTLLVSFAGSIGIIGIALILALSNGINLFIEGVQENTLSSYPLSIQEYTQDMQALLGAMTSTGDDTDYNDGMIHVDDSLGTMMGAMSTTKKNDLVRLRQYIEANRDKFNPLVSDIKYTYHFDMQIFTADGKTQVNPSTLFDKMGPSFSGVSELMGDMSIFSEMLDNQDLLNQQYELVSGSWPTNKDEVVLVVSKNNQISKMTLYMLGVLDQEELDDVMLDLMENGKYDTTPIDPYTFEYFLGLRFKLLNTFEFFDTNGTYTVDGVEYPLWYDLREAGFDQESFVKEHGMELKISGIIRPKEGATASSISGAVGYTKALTDYVLTQIEASEIIHQQKVLTPDHNVLTGATFARTVYTKDTIDKLIDRVGATNMQRFYSVMTAMILKNPEFAAQLAVTPDSIGGFVSTMETEKQAEIIHGMLENIKTLAEADTAVTQSLATLFSVMKQVPGGLSSVDFTTENIVDLLQLLSMEQIAVLVGGVPANPPMPFAIKGLKDLCEEGYMTALYQTLNDDMVNWSLNEKNIVLLVTYMDDAMFATFEQQLYDMVPDKDATRDSNLELLGDSEKAAPASINFYAIDFDSKGKIEAFIEEYNATLPESDRLQYSDIVGTLMSSVTVIIDAISYVLIAFVSISLVVSSIMIGIITYISVLERTKEIGILRAIGASKRDVSRVFNAETLIIGFAAGAIGILATLLFCIPINLILKAVTDMSNIKAVLPVGAAFILIGISMVLTLIAGLIPSGIAAKKDPVVALRTD